MATEFKKRPKHISPIGVAKFPQVTTPSTKFKKEGEYSAKLRFSAEDAAKFRAKHAEELAEAIAEGKILYDALPLQTRKKKDHKWSPQEEIGTDVYNETTEQPTGEVEIKFSRIASGVSKKTNKPWSITLPVFDAKGTPLKGVDIWGGSKLRVSYETSPYFVPGTGAAGLSLRLLSVQVIELVTKGSASAGSYGFDEVEGYEYDPSDGVETETKTDADTAADQDTDF